MIPPAGRVEHWILRPSMSSAWVDLEQLAGAGVDWVSGGFVGIWTVGF